MPFSFIQIEKEKNFVIAFAFISITSVYFLTAYLLLLAAENWFFLIPRAGFLYPSLKHVLITLAGALIIAILHWAFSIQNLIPRISRVIGADELDPQDTYHQYFRNIVEEVSVATGGRKIEPMIIRSVSMNAFALADFSGRAVIGITEGLLARLNRSQIEAVVAHEAAHIANGDCLTTTVLSSLGEIYEESLSRLGSGLKNVRGRGAVFVLAIFFILFLTGLVSKMMRCFLSREREFRADAVAVRLTRNPLSLAEALKLISQKWRGEGAQGQNVPSIFIINPQFNRFDEEEGLFPDMFSTHPPVKARLAVLLSMAHLDEETLDSRLLNFKRVSPIIKPEFAHSGPAVFRRWLILEDTVWQGPFSLDELREIKGLLPTQWVKAEGRDQVEMACDDAELIKLFQEDKHVQFHCPVCKTALSQVNYEGAVISKCSYCSGAFVENEKISRILIRGDYSPSEEVIRFSNLVISSKNKFLRKNFEHKSVWSRDCPKCGPKMHRQFFNYSYPIEVDRCVNCAGIWFDKMELEVLQYIYENRKDLLYG